MAKIKYGISNCYYAKITAVAADGTPTYAAPKALPGAVSLTLSPEGETSPFYADNIIYYSSSSNNGYTGSLELALVPDDFLKDIFGDTLSTNGILAEDASATPSEFALLAQFENDVNDHRIVLYRCTAQRPDVGSSTKEASIEPVTETMNLTVMPRINDHLVKGKADSSASAYASWFTTVQEPA